MKKLILPIYLWLHRAIIKFCWNLFVLFPMDKKKVVFSNFNGGDFGDNPQFVALEFLRRKLGWKLYWVSADNYELPDGILPVRPNTIAFAWHMATAGTWVDNTRKLYYFKKRPGQIYVQTLHGGPGMKKVEGDCAEALTKEYIEYAKIDSRHIDLLLSSCEWDSRAYPQAFWYDGPIFKKGLPKFDIHFQDLTSYRKKILKYFSLPERTKLALYAPTFRDSRKTDMYRLDYDRLLPALQKRFGGDWAVMVRVHPNLTAKDYPVAYSNRILNATPYGSMQELVAVADLVISDYSGCSFEFPMTGRPGFLYAEDYDEIKSTRGFYFEPKDLPFTMARSNEELLKHIEEFDEDAYQEKCKAFRDMLGFYDNGHASEALVDWILEQHS